MPQTLGLPTYYNLKETKAGTQLVGKGEYCGSTISPKYQNLQHNFYEVDGENRHVVLAGGQLDWRAKQGDLKPGGVYDVYFEGKKKLEKGAWAGSEASEFRIDTYSKQEIKDLIDAGAELRNVLDETPEPVEVAPEVVATESESLGDLA